MGFVIPSIFTAIDKFSSPVKHMEGAVSSFAERSERKFRKIGAASMDVAKKSFLLGAAIVAPLVLFANEAIKFEEKMANVSTLVDTSKESMKAMGDEVLTLATKLPVPIDELTSSLYDIRSAGVPAADAMRVLEVSAKLSAAGLATASESTNIMTSAINAFASEGLTAEQISDTLFKTVKAGKTTLSQMAQAFGATAPIVQSAGVKLADFSAATAALTTVGTPAAQAQNQIRASIIAMQKPTEDMTKIFSKLGVKGGPELIKKTGGLVPAMEAIEAQGKAMGINMAKAWSSVEAGAAVTSLTGSTNAAYVATLEDMTKGANAVDAAYQKQLMTGKAQAQLAKNNMQALSIMIGTEVIPIFIALIKRVIPVVQGFIKWTKENPALVKTLVTAAVAIAGLSFAVSGISFAVALVTKTIAAWGLITKAVTVIQWALNAALLANPIGLIIIAIVALIAITVVVIKKYNEWGAAITFLLGPLGILINLAQAFRRNWDLITAAFKTDGILAGFKAIGKTILDALLMPLQQVISLIADVTGAEWATKAAASLEAFRKDMGVNVSTDESGNPLKSQVANPELSKQNSLTSVFEKIQKQNVAIDINDNSGKALVSSDNNLVPVKLSSTKGFGGNW